MPKPVQTTFKFRDAKQREQFGKALEKTGQTRDFVIQKKLDEYIEEHLPKEDGK